MGAPVRFAAAAPDDAVPRTRTVALKLGVLVRQLHRRFDQRMAGIGVTRAQWTMIAVVARHPGPTQREVAELLEMSEAAAGRLIDRLCTEGLLARRPKADDRRAYCIHLTDAADRIIDKMSSVAAEHEREVFVGFDNAELARFEADLDRISANSAAAQRAGA